MPRFGIFVAERLRHLLQTETLSASVLAPVPWFPVKSDAFGGYSEYAKVPRESQLADTTVYHPRFLSIPRVGMSIAPLLLAMASRNAIRRIFGDLRAFDLIDAHYFYPDGVAAALLGQWFDLPVAITARGTDLNLISNYSIPRRQIQWAIRNASAVIAVSHALGTRLIELGADPEMLNVLPNGVDLDKFRLLDRDAVRSELCLAKPMLLSVGNLVKLKGHDLAIKALARMPDMNLAIVGTGPLEKELKSLAQNIGVERRVRFVGALDQSKLLQYYNAADCLVLCSSREGMANVLLESLACGTPVIATPVGGNPEIVRDEKVGVLMTDRTVDALVAAVDRLFSNYPVRADIRSHAEQFDWAATTDGQIQLFERIARTSS